MFFRTFLIFDHFQNISKNMKFSILWPGGDIALNLVIVGSVAGIVSLAISCVMAWVVVSYFLKSTFNFHLASGFWVVLIGISVTVVTSAAFAIGPLNSKPARILRTED